MIWEYFARIYVISIPESPRKDQIHANFASMGITNYEIVDFTPAAKTVNDGSEVDLSLFQILSHAVCDSTCQNITRNHLALIQRAAELDLDNVLIFEDDAVFDLPADESKLHRVQTWLQANPWDMFYFGYCLYPRPIASTITSDIIQVYSPYLAHSYAINRSGIRYIMEHKDLFSNQHVDKVYAQLPLRKYGIWKSICFQSTDPALFTTAMRKLGWNSSLRAWSDTMDTISINYQLLFALLPICILLVIYIVICILYFS